MSDWVPYPDFVQPENMLVEPLGKNGVRVVIDKGATPEQVEELKAAILRSHPYWKVQPVLTCEIEPSVCPSCRNWMTPHSFRWKHPNVRYTDNNTRVNNKQVCSVCYSADQDKTFECDLCTKTWPKSEIQYSDENSYLCQHCYETVTAKVWDDEIEILRERSTYRD